MSDASRSPIKDQPLRTPGQSLEEQRRALLDDKLEPWLLLALFMVMLAGLEWWRYLAQMSLNPVLVTLVAALTVLLAVWRFVRMRPMFRNLRQGIAGEKAVGQFLERLRADGYQVFHAVVAPGFNIDHVLIGPAGIFAVETKTWSKPVRGDARIRFDGEQLLVGQLEPERNPVAQARAEAAWLKATLGESTGRTLEVQPVLLFPGWFIEQAEGSLRKLWVLEPKALPTFLQREPLRLSSEDARLAAFHLSRYIRGVERAL